MVKFNAADNDAHDKYINGDYAYIGAPGEACAGGEGIYWEDGRCVPSGLVDPPGAWILDFLVPTLAIALLVCLAYDSAKRRELTWWILMCIASASTFWLETFGDWGQHLSYSPSFTHYTLDLPFTAPHNPWWMPFMYAVYWTLHTWAILRLAQFYQRKRPGTSLGKAIIVFTVPLTFVWNILVEGTAAYMGWWTYHPAIGPYLDMGRGNFPFFWPMLAMFGWPNLISYLVGSPEERGFNRLEKLAGFERLVQAKVQTKSNSLAIVPANSAWFQTTRLLTWVIVFNLTFIAFLIFPIIGLRLATGWGSFFLP